MMIALGIVNPVELFDSVSAISPVKTSSLSAENSPTSTSGFSENAADTVFVNLVFISGYLDYDYVKNGEESTDRIIKDQRLKSNIQYLTKSEVILSSNDYGVVRASNNSEFVVLGEDSTTGLKLELIKGELYIRTLSNEKAIEVASNKYLITNASSEVIYSVQQNANGTKLYTFSEGINISVDDSKDVETLDSNMLYTMIPSDKTLSTLKDSPLTDVEIAEDSFLMWNLEEEIKLSVKADDLGVLGTISLPDDEQTTNEDNGVKIQGVQDQEAINFY